MNLLKRLKLFNIFWVIYKYIEMLFFKMKYRNQNTLK